MRTTRYWEEQVLRKRPYLRREWGEAIAQRPTYTEQQADGRRRCWGDIPELEQYGRVIREGDGSIPKACPDRNFRGDDR